MFGLFQTDGRAVKGRVFKQENFASIEAAIAFLEVVHGVIVDSEVTEDCADVCAGRSLEIFQVERINHA